MTKNENGCSFSKLALLRCSVSHTYRLFLRKRRILLAQKHSASQSNLSLHQRKFHWLWQKCYHLWTKFCTSLLFPSCSSQTRTSNCSRMTQLNSLGSNKTLWRRSTCQKLLQKTYCNTSANLRRTQQSVRLSLTTYSHSWVSHLPTCNSTQMHFRLGAALTGEWKRPCSTQWEVSLKLFVSIATWPPASNPCLKPTFYPI